jgi:hypothetical protein
MNELNLENPGVPHNVERLNVPVSSAGVDEQVDEQKDVNATTTRGRIPLSLRSRSRVLRVSPPIDDGFRPFRVF